MRSITWGLRSLVLCVVLGGVSLIANPATSAAEDACPVAVDGVNAELAGLGGSAADKDLYGATGILAFPLGCGVGGQIDAVAASFDSRFLGAIGGHLFWRDPAKGLLGLYGSYTNWDKFGGVGIAHIAPEAEWYLGRWSVRGVAGVEFGNSASGIQNGFLQTYAVKTRFFDQINVAYYLTDNFKAFVGHRYLTGKHALALGAEYGFPLRNGVMAALFAEGRIGEGKFHGVWGGLRFYFGHSDKTLIRRHREDDPVDWGASEFGGTTNGFNQTPVITGGGSTPPPPLPD
jgi:hypothetical protein